MKDAITRTCGCPCAPSRKTLRLPSDGPSNATSEELNLIRTQLAEIERTLSALYGSVYSRDPESLKTRRDAADLLDRHFAGIDEQWRETIRHLFGGTPLKGTNLGEEEERKKNTSNALIRFIDHLRDPDDLETYVFLRRHCQRGMISRAKPSQFNAIHIALKQVILRHVYNTLHGRRQDVIRDAVVASIDERRLMVSQFYIESREYDLRASEEKYRNSIDHAPDPMYEIDPESFKVLAANTAAKSTLLTPGEDHSGWSHGKDIEGHVLTDFVPPSMVEETRYHLRAVVEKGFEQGFDVAIGDRLFDVNSALIPYGDKRFIQMIMHDVTQRRAILNELLKTERLVAAGTFAAGVAHEVNNPLASISSLVQSLLGSEVDTSRKMTLHTILSQITRISSTLKDLVNFAKPSSSQVRNEVSLNKVVTETLRLVQFNKRFNGITLRPELDERLWTVYADENEVQQVLLNLLINAADATQREDGLIRIITENPTVTNGDREVPMITLRVIDNGIGIPAEHLDRVFDPFFTTKPAGAGVGLGLSLCQRLVLSNYGSVRVDSEVGKGTTVAVKLPRFSPLPARAAAEASVVQ
ncbi:MAG TPA: ATP-binding protein [Candidatus Binataceae bacterium]